MTYGSCAPLSCSAQVPYSGQAHSGQSQAAQTVCACRRWLLIQAYAGAPPSVPFMSFD